MAGDILRFKECAASRVVRWESGKLSVPRSLSPSGLSIIRVPADFLVLICDLRNSYELDSER